MMRFPHNFHPTPRHFHPRFPVNDGQYPQGPRGFLRPPGHHFHASPGPPRHIIRPQGSMPPQQQQPPYGGPPSHCRGPSPGIHSGQPLRARGAGARGGGAPPNRYHHRQNYNNQPMHMNGPRFPNGDPFHGGHDGIQRCQRFEGPNRTHNQQHPFPKSQVQKKQNGKQKKTKEPKEVDYSHYCDVCDRGFKSEEQFQAHVAEHVQCKAKDCRFFGHPKVVKVHFKMQHGPGAKTIKWLDTPEDIKKWREDRKRNFPTAANIARKREQEEEKRTRGDVLETKEFGKMKRGRGQRGRGQRVRGRGRGQHWGQRQHPGQVSAEVPVQSSSPAEMEDEVPTKKQKTENTSHHTSSLSDAKVSSARDDTDEIGDDQVRPADQHTKDSDEQPDCDPLSLLAENEGSGDEDPTLSQGVCHENQNAVNPAIEVAPKGTVGALGSLAMSYNSDSSEDSGTESTGKEANTDVTPIQTVEQPKPKEDVLTTAKAELEVDKHNDLQSRGHSLSKRKMEQRKQKRRKAPLSLIPSKRRKATLLEMLLAPEICRERNTILQCVRYIVKNGFFQGTDADT